MIKSSNMSKNNRDDFSEKTKRTLAERVTYLCSNPKCPKPTSGPNTNENKSTKIGVAAHIKAASSGGARYDKAMTPDKRKDISNGIWLCAACAKLIDTDVKKYPVEKLHAWKEQAEEKSNKAISSNGQVYSDCNIHKSLTDPPGSITKAQFLFRDEKVNELTEKIRNGENLLLVSGFGGIGKTAVARSLYHHLKEDYKDIAWINYRSNIRESFLSKVNLFLKEKNPDTRWKQIKSFFTDCKKELLIFVDNLPQGIESDESFGWLTGIDARLVATSRLSKVRNFNPYEIDFLSKEQGIEVFYCYYEHATDRTQKEAVKQLVELVSCHTLSIELLAGGANGSKYQNNLDKYLTDLHEHGFGFPKLKIEVGHENTDVTISESLAKLFDLQKMSEDQNHILLNFAIMPRGLQIPMNILELIGFEENALEQLIKSRWISYTENRYLMYDIVWEAVRLQYPKIPYENAIKMIETIYGGDFNYNDEFAVSTIKLQIANAYGEYFFNDRGDERWVKFLICLGQRNFKAGNYGNSLKYFEKALEIQKRLYGRDHPSMAITYNNIAGIYSKKEQYKLALEYYNKALILQKQKPIDKNSTLDIIYSNIGEAYSILGEYENALENFYEALKIQKEIGSSHKETAIIYSNMARVYDLKAHYENDPENDKKALEYLKKAMEIQEKTNDYYNLAFTYNNIGDFFYKRGEYKVALTYFEKALRIHERLQGSEHPDTVITYKNFSMLSSMLNENPLKPKKIGVNEPCPCGSGKKYKKCCRGKGIKF